MQKIKSVEFIGDGLARKIDPFLENSIEIKIVTAFLKRSSLPFFLNIKHKNIEIICGQSFFLTEPEAVEEYSKRFKSVKIFEDKEKNGAFHPKCFYIKTEDGKEVLVVGSSNMTAGGMSKNKEASIILKSGNADNKQAIDDFKDYFEELEKHSYSKNSDVFDKYKKDYEAFRKRNPEFISMACKEEDRGCEPAEAGMLNIDDWVWHEKFAIGSIIEIYKSDKTAMILFLERKLEKDKKYDLSKFYKLEKFDSEVINSLFKIGKEDELQRLKKEYDESECGKKEMNRRIKLYKKWQTKLESKLSQAEIENFYDDFRILGIQRQKRNVSKNPEIFNNCLKVVSNNKESIYNRFNRACGKEFNGINSATVSIILSILNQDVCPVYNGGSLATFEYFGIEPFAKKGNDGEKYTICQFIEQALKTRYHFKNLMDVDCFIGFLKDEKNLF